MAQFDHAVVILPPDGEEHVVEYDPAKKGICSNFLCNTQPVSDMVMTGPARKVILSPRRIPARTTSW